MEERRREGARERLRDEEKRRKGEEKMNEVSGLVITGIL